LLPLTRKDYEMTLLDDLLDVHNQLCHEVEKSPDIRKALESFTDLITQNADALDKIERA